MTDSAQTKEFPYLPGAISSELHQEETQVTLAVSKYSKHL